MEFSWRFKTNMLNSIVNYCNDGTVRSFSSSHDRNNVYQRFLCVPIEGDTIEIPCFCRDFVEKALSKNVHYPSLYNYKKVLMPLFIQSPLDTKRTGDAIITSLFNTRYKGVKQVNDGKQNPYYGNSGFIMDKDFTPLFMTAIQAKINRDRNSEIPIITYTGTLVRINPIVFDRTDGVVEKVIVKKLINLYTSRCVANIYGTGVDNTADLREKKVAKVIIDDFNDYIVTPIAPTISQCNDEKLNDILIDNLSDIK